MKKLITLIFGILLSLNVSGACTYATFAEGVDRAYAAGDTVIRAGAYYELIQPGWGNVTAQDGTWAPGTGSAWTLAWTLRVVNCTTVPVVTGVIVLDVTCSSATITGNISDDGGAPILTDGIIYYTGVVGILKPDTKQSIVQAIIV